MHTARPYLVEMWNVMFSEIISEFFFAAAYKWHNVHLCPIRSMSYAQKHRDTLLRCYMKVSIRVRVKISRNFHANKIS